MPRLGSLIFLGILLGVTFSLAVAGYAGSLGPLVEALSDANTEMREDVFPAISYVFGGAILISIAALVVSVLRRGG